MTGNFHEKNIFTPEEAAIRLGDPTLEEQIKSYIKDSPKDDNTRWTGNLLHQTIYFISRSALFAYARAQNINLNTGKAKIFITESGWIKDALEYNDPIPELKKLVLPQYKFLLRECAKRKFSCRIPLKKDAKGRVYRIDYKNIVINNHLVIVYCRNMLRNKINQPKHAYNTLSIVLTRGITKSAYLLVIIAVMKSRKIFIPYIIPGPLKANSVVYLPLTRYTYNTAKKKNQVTKNQWYKFKNAWHVFEQ